MNFRPIALLPVLGSFALASCESLPAMEAGHVLTRNNWQLVSMTVGGNQVTNLTAEQQRNHTLSFQRDGSIFMKLDCNNGNATWNASEPTNGTGVLTISQVAATRAFCPPPSYGEDMAADLPSARNYTISANGRTLTISARHVTLAFAASR